MRQLTSGLMLPLTNITGGALSGQTDLSAMGLKLLDSGKLAVDETLYAAASSTLQTRLSAGVRIGYSSTSLLDLSSQIGDMLVSGGLIQDRIDSEKNTQSELNTRKTNLQEKLVAVQARYTAQYASLDALLFKLQGTSDSLKSALDGLTNSQKN
jgi:flagellar hook-associated protein 2